MPNQPSSQALHNELRTLRTRVGVLPKWGIGTTGTVLLGAVAFDVGWKIGSSIRAKYMTNEIPAGLTGFSGNIEVVSTTLTPVNQGVSLLTSTAPYAPSDGFKVRQSVKLNGGAPYTSDSFAECKNNNYPETNKAPVGSSLHEIVGSTVSCTTQPGTGKIYAAFVPYKAKTAPTTHDGESATFTNGTTPADVPDELAKQRVRTQLDTYANDYPTLIPWLDSQLGGPGADPTGATVTIPSPNGDETYSQYITRLQAQGLVGTRVDTAIDTSVGPDVVTGTTPAPGTRVTAGTTVEVKTNPANAPAPSNGFFTPPTIPAFSLPSVPLACTTFPFGVPCWVKDLLSQWSGSPVTPSWTFHFPFQGDGETTTISMEMFDSYMGTIRTVAGIAICASMTWLFFSLAFGGVASKGGSKDD